LNDYYKEEENESRTIHFLFIYFSSFVVLIAVTSENELWLNGWMEWILLSDGVTTGTLFIKHFPSGWVPLTHYISS